MCRRPYPHQTANSQYPYSRYPVPSLLGYNAVCPFRFNMLISAIGVPRKDTGMPIEGKISVIIPIYNCAEHLGRCMDSILGSSYQNIEVIGVDDGSNDGSAKVLDSYGKLDDRVIAVHQQNHGVAAARNVGLSIAQGDFIAFIDSDDYIDGDYFETLLTGLEKSGADICYCSACDEDECGKIIKCSYSKDALVSSSQFDWLFPPYDHLVVWGAVYRRQTIDGIRFNENLFVAEDSLFFAECVKNSNKLLYIGKPLYHYVWYRESASHGHFDGKKYTELAAWQEICKLFNYEPSVCSALASRCKACGERYYRDAAFRAHFLEKTLALYRSNFPALMKVAWREHDFKCLLTATMFRCFPKAWLTIKSKR